MHRAWLQCLAARRTLLCCFQAGQETRLAENMPAAQHAMFSTLSATHTTAPTCVQEVTHLAAVPIN